MTRPAWRLDAEDGRTWLVPGGRPVILGRGEDCDLCVPESVISRRHAQLEAGDDGVRVRDLDSSNGTWRDDTAIDEAVVPDGARLAFGNFTTVVRRGVEAPDVDDHDPGTRVRAVPLGEEIEAELAGLPPGEVVRRLAALVTVAARLASAASPQLLLERIVDSALDLLPADRVAVLRREEGGDLVQSVARSRLPGDDEPRVPRSVARAALEAGEAIQTDNAAGDTRFQGASVVRQSVRSALCAPLLDPGRPPLGAVYADILGNRSFAEADLQLLAAFAGVAAASLRHARAAESLRRAEVVRAHLERFVAPDVAADIARAGGETRAGGTRTDVVVLFTDIREFTPLAESMPPEEVATFLSRYCSAMAEVVFQHGGTLDKFIGDAVMACWGAPRAQPDAADRALRAAAAMQRAVQGLSQRSVRSGGPAFGIGIGIHHGAAFAGTIGSPRRLEYTVLGETVNLASRVCGVAVRGETLVTAQVAEALTGPRPPLVPLLVELVGVARPPTVFAVDGEASPRR